jgi:hypothetical protein
MDHEILLWINANQEYLTGLALYDRYGHSPKIGMMLRIGEATAKNRLTLSNELGKSANLNKANRGVKKIRISEGGISGTVVDPKKIFQICLA